MPTTSQSQRRLIFGKRNQYKSEKNTPKNWKWIWSEDYENKGKLPEKVKKESLICKFNTFVNEKYDNEKKVDDMSPSELKDDDIKYKLITRTSINTNEVCLDSGRLLQLLQFLVIVH